MHKRVAIVLINYKDYARKYLTDCIRSIRAQDYQGEMKVFITDNKTSAESFEFLTKTAPEAELVLNKNNDGFAKGNNDAMKLAVKQGFDYIALFNTDTIIGSNCVSGLIKAAEADKKIGAVQARLMLWPNKNKINSLGNDTHFLGFGYCRGYGTSPPAPLLSKERGEIKIFYPSGAAVLFRREVLEEVGLFDEEYWMYNEDQDLGWRIWLAGFRCVLAPQAVVYHKYEFSRSIKKYYWLDRNRMISIVKNYHLLTLIIIFPACLVMELGLILFSLKTGWFKEKIRVYKYFFTPAKWKYLYKERRKIQGLRKIKDKDIVKMIVGRIWYQEVGDIKLRLINPIFNVYWKLARLFIVW